MRRKYIYLFFLLAIAVLCIIGIVVCNQLIKRHAVQKLYTEVTNIPKNNVGLLLGTSPKLKSGNNNLYFDYRILATVDLYNAGKISYILVSGDNRKKDYNEPEEMKKALMRNGIPQRVIYLDYAGLRTLDSVIRAKEIFGQTRITIISQKFHNERAIYIAAKNGIDAIGFNANDVDTYSGFKTRIRELFARMKMFIDLAIEKQPKFLGEKVILPVRTPSYN